MLISNDGILSMATNRGGWNLYFRKKYMTSEGYQLIGGEEVELRELKSFKKSERLSRKVFELWFKEIVIWFLVKVDRTSMKNSLEVRSPF